MNLKDMALFMSLSKPSSSKSWYLAIWSSFQHVINQAHERRVNFGNARRWYTALTHHYLTCSLWMFLGAATLHQQNDVHSSYVDERRERSSSAMARMRLRHAIWYMVVAAAWAIMRWLDKTRVYRECFRRTVTNLTPRWKAVSESFNWAWCVEALATLTAYESVPVISEILRLLDVSRSSSLNGFWCMTLSWAESGQSHTTVQPPDPSLT